MIPIIVKPKEVHFPDHHHPGSIAFLDCIKMNSIHRTVSADRDGVVPFVVVSGLFLSDAI